MIRTSKHKIDYSNSKKLEKYIAFLTEMRRVAGIYVDFLWNTHYEWCSKGKTNVMDITKEQLEVPPFFDYNLIPCETTLSGRAKSSLITQCCGIVKACTEKHRRRLYLLEEKKKNNEEIPKKLQENIDNFKPQKPNTDYINLEISSKCSDFQKSEKNYFEGFLRLKSLGVDKDTFGMIKIPIKFHKQANNWKNKKAEMLQSFLLCNNKIEIRWKLEVPLKKEGREVGADQGKIDILVLSDKQVTLKTNKQGISQEMIIDKLARRKKGSKNFRQTQKERENFVNYTINRLNFSGIRKLNLEKIVNINFGKRMSRKMKHWLNTLIVNKTKRICEELGVQVAEQSSAYKSQRCSCCGIVLKKNRKGKEYFCHNCGNMIDADLNASINHEVNLPDVPFWLSNLHLNKTEGFFWKPEGFFKVNGEEFRVPHSLKNVIVN